MAFPLAPIPPADTRDNHVLVFCDGLCLSDCLFISAFWSAGFPIRLFGSMSFLPPIELCLPSQLLDLELFPQPGKRLPFTLCTPLNGFWFNCLNNRMNSCLLVVLPLMQLTMTLSTMLQFSIRPLQAMDLTHRNQDLVTEVWIFEMRKKSSAGSMAWNRRYAASSVAGSNKGSEQEHLLVQLLLMPDLAPLPFIWDGDRPTFSSTPLLQPYLLDELLKCFSIKGCQIIELSFEMQEYCKHSSHTTSRVGFKYLFSSRPIISLAIEGLPNCSGLLIKWLWEGEMKIFLKWH